MTKEVISAWKNLETKVETLRAYIQLGLDNLSKLRNNLSILNDNFNEIITNKNYKFTMEKIEKRTVPTGVCNTWWPVDNIIAIIHAIFLQMMIKMIVVPLVVVNVMFIEIVVQLIRI